MVDNDALKLSRLGPLITILTVNQTNVLQFQKIV